MIPIIIVILSVQYFTIFILLIMDSGEKDRGWKIIKSKAILKYLLIPFGFIKIFYNMVRNTYKNLDDE